MSIEVLTLIGSRSRKPKKGLRLSWFSSHIYDHICVCAFINMYFVAEY